ncbi:unnamed protein product [Vicia faba]|uniref:Uncharacterized protein n=1 Tax=Vicia faba TaxID=3906 RepID=A0AAV0YQF7_VICFA|nr:unnamed protein product [Vicia faba]
MSHVLRLKNSGCSGVDQPEIHRVYIILHKIKICWPYYFVSRIFTIKESAKGNLFCHSSMIAKIINYNNRIPNILYRFSIDAQEYTQCTLTNMGYIWDEQNEAYYFRIGKTGDPIYNSDDPGAFDGNVVEQHGEENNQEDVNMVDGEHKQDAPWMQADSNQGWRRWLQQTDEHMKYESSYQEYGS